VVAHPEVHLDVRAPCSVRSPQLERQTDSWLQQPFPPTIRPAEPETAIWEVSPKSGSRGLPEGGSLPIWAVNAFIRVADYESAIVKRHHQRTAGPMGDCAWRLALVVAEGEEITSTERAGAILAADHRRALRKASTWLSSAPFSSGKRSWTNRTISAR
jgi:hypothetical protein